MERLPAGSEKIEVADALPKGLERRLVLRLLGYWRSICGDRSFPSFAEVDPAAIPDMWPHCFVLEVVGQESDPVFRHVGVDLASHSDVLLAGRRLSDVPSNTLAAHAVSYAQAVIAKRVPVSRGGEFNRDGNIRVLYRSIILPMSDDGETVSGLFGAANCREEQKEE
jgi:hypothetical protein